MLTSATDEDQIRPDYHPSRLLKLTKAHERVMAEEFGYPLELFVHAVDQNYVCPVWQERIRFDVVITVSRTEKFYLAFFE